MDDLGFSPYFWKHPDVQYVLLKMGIFQQSLCDRLPGRVTFVEVVATGVSLKY